MQQETISPPRDGHTAPAGAKNYKVVYTIVTRERDGQKFWLRVGAAFRNRDGSINIKLDAMPTNGELQIRDQRSDRPDRGAEDARPGVH